MHYEWKSRTRVQCPIEISYAAYAAAYNLDLPMYNYQPYSNEIGNLMFSIENGTCRFPVNATFIMSFLAITFLAL